MAPKPNLIFGKCTVVQFKQLTRPINTVNDVRSGRLAKRAQKIREDHLERQETAEELRERIRVLFKLKETPDDKHVKFLLSRLEKYKTTGYV